jgi:hypothetical protein
MMRKLLLLFFAMSSFFAKAQMYTQYFDGPDTISTSLKIKKDTGSLWQIGRPQKSIFDSAATKPNALLTDTFNNYPPNDTSRFSFVFPQQLRGNVYIVAVRWKQKLDMEKKHAGGIVEYSLDTGKTWKNVFNNPQVYKFYGYDTLNNRDTLNGIYTFSGTDTTWRDIWLCFDGRYVRNIDSMMLRYTFMSDTSVNTGEGWMIDNMMMHATYVHTVTNVDDHKRIKVYPTNGNGIIHIELQAGEKNEEVVQVLLLGTDGKLLQTYKPQNTKTVIDIGNMPNGMYYLKVVTNKTSVTYPVSLGK